MDSYRRYAYLQRWSIASGLLGLIVAAVAAGPALAQEGPEGEAVPAQTGIAPEQAPAIEAQAGGGGLGLSSPSASPILVPAPSAVAQAVPQAPAVVVAPATPTARAPMPSGPSIELVVQPLLLAAESDLATGRISLALARTQVVISAVPENLPSRIRAEGLYLLATQRQAQDASVPSIDEVYAPLVAQAELEMRAGSLQTAVPRLDFVISRVPPNTPLGAHAVGLRGRISVVTPGTIPPAPQQVPMVAPMPMQMPPPPPTDPTRRGTGEAIELYVAAGLYGSLTGGLIPTLLESPGSTIDSVTYSLTILAGTGLMAAGALTLDLTGSLRTGIAPTIASSLRIGLMNGILVASAVDTLDAGGSGLDDVQRGYALSWGGATAGAILGISLGFGLQPTVQDARFVESTALWGLGMGTFAGMIAEFDGATGPALMLGGMNLGVVLGIIMAASDSHPSTKRTLLLDAGFLGGAGALGLAIGLGYAYDNSSSSSGADPVVFGIGMGLGSVAGWTLVYLLTSGMDAEPEAVDGDSFFTNLHIDAGPVEGGATVNLRGAF